jgi:RHS repeat-associated protein
MRFDRRAEMEGSMRYGWTFRLVLAVAGLMVGGASITPSAVASSNVGVWGRNLWGSLGTGSTSGPEACKEAQCTTVPVGVEGLTGVSAVAAQEHNGMALLSNETVEIWGSNYSGQLGDGTHTGPETCPGELPCSTKPVAVNGLSEATAIATSGEEFGGHSAAVLRSGKVVDWGSNESGALGNGSGEREFDEPVTVTGISTATAVAALDVSTCALLSSGGIDCWGSNQLGMLGNGGTESSSTPVAVSGITTATALVGAGTSACALLSSGKIDCWGAADEGQLGDGTSTGPETCGFFESACSRTPVAVSGISTATAIATSGSDVCAVLSGGSVDCWGGNPRGELGDGIYNGPENVCGEKHTSPCSTTPVEVKGLTTATAVAVGGNQACAIVSGGTVDCWGWNVWGQLGDGLLNGPESCEEQSCSTIPVQVGGLTGVAGLAAGGSFELVSGPSLRIERRRLEPEEEYGAFNEGVPNHKRACAGDPISCAGGNLSESQTDLHLAGRGQPLQLARTYNAQAAVTQASPELFGYGWSSNLGERLIINAGAKTVAVVQPNGSTAVFTGEPGVPGVLSAPKWVQARLVLNGDGTYTYTLPTQLAAHFDGSGRLLSEADRSGNTTTMNRNAEGRLESVTDAAGRKLSLAYNAGGEVETVTDPMGHTVKYAYEAGQLTSVTLPGETGPRWQFKYDASHRLTTMTDGRGGATTNEYDTANRVISQTDPASRTTGFEYGSRQTTITNKVTGAVTKESFTLQNEPEAITTGYGTSSATTESFKYDEAGDLVSATDGNGDVTKYGYDSGGDRTSMIDAGERETKWTYDSTHDVETTTTPKGETTTFKRDSHGNAESLSRPAPGSTTQATHYEYDTHGQLTRIEDPLKRVWKYEYDAQGDRTAAIDPEGDKQTWAYNEDSQETASVSSRGNVTGGEPGKYTTKTERDAQGRAIKITDPLGHQTKYSYDGDGNVETETDANGHTKTYTYDGDSERTKIKAPNGAVTETGYDGAGKVTSQSDGNKHETKYVRNIVEQVTEVIDPLGRKTTREYDAAGNLKKVTDQAKRTTTYTYDPANRLKEVSYSESATHAVKYEYDADGDRTSMTDGTGTTTNIFDQLDRLTESKDGHGDITKYEYDLASEQAKITYPNGKAVTRAFDKAGRLEKVTDWFEHTTKFAYNPDSQLATAAFPSGTSNVDKYAYNEADQMSEVAITKGAETLASLLYTRDNDGQVKGATTKGLPGEEKPVYEYDPNNRLTKGAGLAYEYDAASNPTKSGSSSNTFDSADELKTGSGVTYGYDERGERTKRTPTSGAATTYGYDQAGNLISVTRPKEGKVAEIKDTYAYDGTRLRASQTLSGTPTFLTWNGTETVPLVLSDGANNYIYGPAGVPVEQISSSGTVIYLHHDQQGSTRLLTSSTGAKEAAFTYDAFGNTTGTTGTAKTPLGYDAQYTSPDTGLIYLRARTYDPATAQFLSVDPAGAVTRAPYTYAGDNPLTAADPTGLWSSSSAANAIRNGEEAVNSCETAAEKREQRREEEGQTRWEEESTAQERAQLMRLEALRRLKEEVARENAKEQQEVAREESPWPGFMVDAAKAVGGCLVGGDVGLVTGGVVGLEVGGPAGGVAGAGAGEIVGCAAGAIGALTSPVNPLEPSEGGP